MKSVIENGKETSKYPCLKISEIGAGKVIVLFYYENTGVCLYSLNAPNHIGDSGDYWEEKKYFTPFNGKLVLSNESL